MDKMRIETAPAKQMADERAEWMKQKGYTVEGPVERRKATWANYCPNGSNDVARTGEGIVWVVIGTKSA